MLELSVTAASPRKIPAVFFKKADEITYFHIENNKLFAESEEDV